MSQHAAGPQVETGLERDVREGSRAISGDWWVWLVAGIAWIVVSLVILQFDQASITTVGILVGVHVPARRRPEHRLRRVPARALGLGCCSARCSSWPRSSALSTRRTRSRLADILGFLFLIVGVWWMIRAFLERALNPLWWLGLFAGILMTALAFWTPGSSSSRRHTSCSSSPGSGH